MTPNTERLSDEREAEDYVPLSRTIDSVEQVEAMSIEELESSLALHEEEVIRITSALEAHRNDTRWALRARHAERVLRLHKSWVERELKARRHLNAIEVAAQARQAKAEAHQKAVEQARAEKMARIAASNDENLRQYAVFKAVAREVLGAEQYLHLWTLVRQRMDAPSHMPPSEKCAYDVASAPVGMLYRVGDVSVVRINADGNDLPEGEYPIYAGSAWSLHSGIEADGDGGKGIDPSRGGEQG